MQPPSPDDQPTIRTAPPNGSRPAPKGWQAPSVEEMQAMLPQYEIMEILGRGGMGAVYKGRQKSLKRLVAIKILPLGMADDEMKFAERFQNEAQTMARLNHPNIVNVHDAGETADGLLYFVMEHVEGRDLAHEIAQRGRLPQAEVKAIALQVVDSLAYAHANGIVHRDIKLAMPRLPRRHLAHRHEHDGVPLRGRPSGSHAQRSHE
jgi:serine/threonine protein kinase